MSFWDKLFGPRQTARVIELPPTPKRKAVEFHRFVQTGYLDSAGKWHATQQEADRDSAYLHMMDRIGATQFRAFIGIEPGPTPGEILAEPDVIRAMSILGAV